MEENHNFSKFFPQIYWFLHHNWQSFWVNFTSNTSFKLCKFQAFKWDAPLDYRINNNWAAIIWSQLIQFSACYNHGDPFNHMSDWKLPGALIGLDMTWTVPKRKVAHIYELFEGVNHISSYTSGPPIPVSS